MYENTYIERLKERIREKPGSRLFLSLAEEYRKNDNIDDAIAILIDGIKKNPDFLAARITLGRWYLLFNMVTEAKTEFLEITETAPDNIFALKGLAGVFENLGLMEDAVAVYKRILEISPFDEEAASFLGSIGAGLSAVEAAETEALPDAIPPVEIQEASALPVETEAPQTEAPRVSMHVTEGEEEQKVESADTGSGQLMEAERLIASGQYRRALRIFNTMLFSSPDDKKILQMKEELTALIKLVGRDKESLINQLNKFMFFINDRFVIQRAKRKGAAVNRLNRLLGSIKSQFVQENT